MTLRSRACLFVLFALTTATVHAAEATVGSLGDCGRIEFTGNKAYTADQIRKELDEDLEILVARRSESELSQWLQTLQSRIQFGYHADGYAEARIAARVDAARNVLIVDINEGLQYHCGKVEFVGVKTLPVDQFRHLLSITRIERTQRATQAPIPPDLPPKDTDLCRPMWAKEMVARCADNYWKTRRTSFRSIFQSLGYFDPQFVVRVRPEADKTATLIIDIQDEGPRSTLDAFEITGLTKNTPQDLIKYLDIPLGTPLNLDVKRQIERKLWESARFMNYHVSIVPPKAGDDPSQTRVDIVASESDDAPLLNDPLSPEQQAFLRLFQWLASIDEMKGDLESTMTLSSSTLNESSEEEAEKPANARQPEPDWLMKCRMIVSSQHQALFFSTEVIDKAGKPLLGYTLHMTPKRLTFDSLVGRARFEIKDFDAKMILNIDWGYKKGKKQPEKFVMGAGYATRRATSSPFQVRAVMPPALALHLFEKDIKTLELNDDVASIALGDKLRFSFDRQTGVMQSFKFERGVDKIETSMSADIYAGFIAKYEESMAGARIFTPGDRPVTSFLQFLSESTNDSPIPTVARLSQFGQRMLERDSFRGLDTLLNQFVIYMGENEFRIPDDSPSPLVREHSSWAPYLYSLSEAVLPQKEVTRAVTREATLAQVMRNYHETSEVSEAFAEGKTGPVTDLLASLVFQWIDEDAPKAFSAKRPKDVTLEAFHRDCDLFLNDDWAVGQLLLGLTAAIQTSDEIQIDDLMAALSSWEESLVSLRPLVMLIRSERNKPPREVLMNLLDGLWASALRPGLAAQFKERKPADPRVPPAKIGNDKDPFAPTPR